MSCRLCGLPTTNVYDCPNSLNCGNESICKRQTCSTAKRVRVDPEYEDPDAGDIIETTWKCNDCHDDDVYNQ